ncbi:centrosomal protein of 131 kDa isoform X5 [Dasypus novemcinctus]|uniref:centrosomal protein of 131 kDa isoform X5 n=1 Tax=Dasypus novemcinctus TaxID=9361 RepID=UPI00265D7DDA|nr:centrosomal protein of 131 kDa isoform X6 [Dasypus novemcinctus]
MKGSRATSGPPGPPEGSPEGVDLSLTGLPPPVSRRPRSASAARPVARPVSVVAGSELRRRAPDAMGPRGPRAINNLRRSNSTTLASRPSSGALSPPSSLGGLRPAEPTNFLTLFEGSPGGRKRPAGPSHARSAQGAAGNVLDEPPSAPALPPSTPAQPTAPWRKERTVALAPSFTANNRPLLPSPGQRAWGWSEGFWSSKRAAGNCVPSMVHNHCGPPERPPPPESAPRAAPPLNNVVAAAAGEALEGSGPGRPQKVPGSTRPDRSHARGPPGLLRRKEVTEEEAERFILQVNQAAVIIQRWYRRQVQRRRAGAAGLQRLLASKREERRRPGEGGVLDLRREKEAERRKAREEQARQARRAAIEELQQGRTRQAGDGAAGLPQERRALGGPRAAQELHPEPRDAAPRALQANNAGANSCPACPEDPRQPASSSSPDAVPEPRQSPEDKPQDAGSPETASEDPMVAGSRAKAHVALRLLLDTLRLLEEEPEPLPHPKAWPQGRLAWTDRPQGVLSPQGDSSSLTADNLEQLGRLGGPPEDGALLSEAKLHSILSFLGEMEGAGRGGNPAAPAPREGLGPGEEPARPGPASEASVSVLRLTQEVEEKRRAAALLQQALAQQQDLAARRVAETREALGRQLRQQQGRYEATIRRHLTFIDQLIEDKKVLTERCEAVVAELRQVDERCKARVAQVQEQHEQETKKLKDLMSATEKVRREKWINEKTRKIKEMTVKGLEPEIQRLIAKHKQELKALKGLHEAELLRAEERAAQRYAQQAEELRERLEREKAALGQRERELAQQRLEQHLEQEQRALEQQRRRLHSEVAEERERLGQQAARQRVELEELRRQLEESSSAASRALRAEFEKGREEQERRHQAELEALKDQLEVEKQAWGASYAKREEAWLLAREQELKEELRKGRDREIELVIRRLEADTALAKEESERSAESRVKRLRDKYETELAELERSEHGLQERCAELRARLGEAEGQRGRLQVLLRQREEELEGAKAVNAQLLGERSGLAQVVRQEFADRLAASEEEARRARAELAELRARQHVELERLMREKEEELQEVHRRVKTAVARKEETLRGLRQQHEAALKRAEHLEELLERQRQPLATT